LNRCSVKLLTLYEAQPRFLDVDAFTVVTVWLVAFFSGALSVVGVIQVVSGRVFLNFRRDWSEVEARRLGWSRVVQGLSLGAYALVGGLIFGAHTIPLFWVGHPWGAFVSLPLMLVFLGALVYQLLIDIRHGNPGVAERS